jgi:hypothetical protein
MPRKHKSNNPSGRPAGSPNRTTREIRELLQKVIDSELDVVQDNLNKLTPDKRIDVLLKILPYCLLQINPVDPEQEPENQPSQRNTIQILTQRMMERVEKLKDVRSEHPDEQPQ